MNSLWGAVLVQGVLLATGLRKAYPGLPITEAHPKALLKALGDPRWQEIAERFGLTGAEAKQEGYHERDALLAAAAAREGSAGRWKHDLALWARLPGEQDPAIVSWGPVHYWWPEAATKNK